MSAKCIGSYHSHFQLICLPLTPSSTSAVIPCITMSVLCALCYRHAKCGTSVRPWPVTSSAALTHVCCCCPWPPSTPVHDCYSAAFRSVLPCKRPPHPINTPHYHSQSVMERTTLSANYTVSVPHLSLNETVRTFSTCYIAFLS